MQRIEFGFKRLLEHHERIEQGLVQTMYNEISGYSEIGIETDPELVKCWEDHCMEKKSDGRDSEREDLLSVYKTDFAKNRFPEDMRNMPDEELFATLQDLQSRLRSAIACSYVIGLQSNHVYELTSDETDMSRAICAGKYRGVDRDVEDNAERIIGHSTADLQKHLDDHKFKLDECSREEFIRTFTALFPEHPGIEGESLEELSDLELREAEKAANSGDAQYQFINALADNPALRIPFFREMYETIQDMTFSPTRETEIMESSKADIAAERERTQTITMEMVQEEEEQEL